MASDDEYCGEDQEEQYDEDENDVADEEGDDEEDPAREDEDDEDNEEEGEGVEEGQEEEEEEEEGDEESAGEEEDEEWEEYSGSDVEEDEEFDDEVSNFVINIETVEEDNEVLEQESADFGGLAGLAALGALVPKLYGDQGHQNEPPPSYADQEVLFQPPARKPDEPKYAYSRCSGNRKALLIGINYIGQDGELRGCHSDVDRMYAFLTSVYGYPSENIIILKDDSRLGEANQPTFDNIAMGINWLCAGAKTDDALFLHYSGHGGQVPDTDGDEGDGLDECIFPVDFKEVGDVIRDDDIYAHSAKVLPSGCRLTCIFDSCHSGSVLDLGYIYNTSGKLKDPVLTAESKDQLMSALASTLSGAHSEAAKFLFNAGKAVWKQKKSNARLKKKNNTQADVILWSGCKDEQTSADAVVDDTATGVLSWAFMSSLSQYPTQSYSQLLNTMRDEIKKRGYQQKPQLSCSHPLETSLVFIL